MQFRVLGPLEVLDDRRHVSLGGVRRKAALGYLLLRHGQVVSTSDLIDALWPATEPPVSARQILQNAVWRLRQVLAPHRGQPDATSLVTQPPGYRLAVDPSDIDAHQFRAMVAQGRERLGAGSPAAAAQLLRSALQLWRGSALADLAETGIAWPELSALENARLDAMEDYFEAELASGRHKDVLGELEAMVEQADLRERSYAQLMIALYRSGRQVDALNVYSRARSILIERVGLEPGRELQDVQRAILSQDPRLNLDERQRTRHSVRLGVPAGAAGAVLAAEARPVVPPERVVQAGRAITMDPAALAADWPTGLSGAEAIPWRQVSVLLVRARLTLPAADRGARSSDEILEAVSRWIHARIESFEGTVTGTIGTVSMALFGPGGPGEQEDNARRAVLAAMAVRHGIAAAEFLPTGFLPPGWQGVERAGRLSVQAAVATGEALIQQHADGREQPPFVVGALLHTCETLLTDARPGEILVCGSTRLRTAPVAEYANQAAAPGADRWAAVGVRAGFDAGGALPGSERQFEISLLSGLLERVRHRSTPHMVTVVGTRCTGKTRFLADLERTFSVQAHVARLALGNRAGPASVAEAGAQLCAWRRLETPALDQPLVLLLDDVHRADESLLDLVASLSDLSGVPLLVVATAGPELLQLRPEWGGGKLRVTTLTFEPAPEAGPALPVSARR